MACDSGRHRLNLQAVISVIKEYKLIVIISGEFVAERLSSVYGAGGKSRQPQSEI